MQVDQVVGYIIQEFYRQNNNNKQTMSRKKLPCTRCGAHLSSTWRPGPCGSATLCNKCGVMYMVRQHRPRLTDLVLDSKRCVWMTRQQDTLQWQEFKEADTKDPRIKLWREQEEERVAYVESKKRKFVQL
jgi:hypothetical protein